MPVTAAQFALIAKPVEKKQRRTESRAQLRREAVIAEMMAWDPEARPSFAEVSLEVLEELRMARGLLALCRCGYFAAVWLEGRRIRVRRNHMEQPQALSWQDAEVLIEALREKQRMERRAMRKPVRAEQARLRKWAAR